MKTKQSRLIVVVHAYMCLLTAGVWRSSAGLSPLRLWVLNALSYT